MNYKYFVSETDNLEDDDEDTIIDPLTGLAFDEEDEDYEDTEDEDEDEDEDEEDDDNHEEDLVESGYIEIDEDEDDDADKVI